MAKNQIDFPQCSQNPDQRWGRKREEDEHPHRNCYQRDRERIVHSTAFRRLDGKTQVFISGSGDHYRTRLTHTIEVASLTRAITRGLGLCEDLGESIALAHDLGHPPFGHAGEATLDGLMAEHGGFDHNEQSLRVVELLEESYPQQAGLNLSYEVLEGLRKHHGKFILPNGNSVPSPSLEAQIANLSDEVAYYSHDLEDGLEAGILKEEELSEIELWSMAEEQARREAGFMWEGSSLHSKRKFTLRCLVNIEFNDIVGTTRLNIMEAGALSVDEIRNNSKRLADYSTFLGTLNGQLRKYLYQNFYGDKRVVEANKQACNSLEVVFQEMVDAPHKMGYRAVSRIPIEGLYRTVADYVSGMTDRYVLSLANNL